MSESLPLVSIITVCRNAASTIERTLRSVKEQKYPSLEYIIIDGGSTDATLDLVQACPAVTRWISEADAGIADAFNKGLALAKGEWIGFINADDWYEPDTVATVMQWEGSADVIHGAVRYWTGESPREVYYPCQERLRKEMTINHPSVFVRRRVYDTLGGFDPSYKYAMDYELMLRIFVAGYRFWTVPDKTLANMRYGGASDAHWQRAVLESARARSTHLSSPCSNWAYCAWQLLRGSTRRLLEKLGLHAAIRCFRRNCSILRKE